MTKLGLSDVFVQSSDKLFCPPPPKNRPLCNFSKPYQSLTHLGHDKYWGGDQIFASTVTPISIMLFRQDIL